MVHDALLPFLPLPAVTAVLYVEPCLNSKIQVQFKSSLGRHYWHGSYHMDMMLYLFLRKWNEIVHESSERPSSIS